MRGRFAPSPTGELHLGNLRTALLAWLQVRAAGGRFVMRMENLDFERVRPGYMEAQLAGLRWLGLNWDEGPDVGGPFAPYVQSERRERYAAALDHLTEQGYLFHCRCSRKEIAAAASAPHGPEDEGPRYPGTCRADTPQKPGNAGKRLTALRFRVSDEPVRVDDLLQGTLRFNPAEDAGDFVVRRKDGVAAYQLAVVVDDAAMQITHVLRGADLLPSTARQLLLYRALALAPPVFLHVPLMLSPAGERLSKRHGSVTLREAREAGATPEAVVGWLASTCGLAAPGEEVPAAALVSRFAPERLRRDATVLRELPWFAR